MTLTTIKTIIAAIIILLVVVFAVVDCCIIFAGSAIHNMSEDLRGVNGDS